MSCIHLHDMYYLSKELKASKFVLFILFSFLNYILIFIGVAVGSGWQAYVAYINLGCYYLLGVPLGFIMGWGFHYGVMVCSSYFTKFSAYREW